MTVEERDRLFKELTDHEISLMRKKSADYTKEADTLEFFDRVGKETGLSGQKVLQVLIAIKVNRLHSLMSKPIGSQNFEGINDTIVDLRNYQFYLICILERNEKLLPK